MNKTVELLNMVANTIEKGGIPALMEEMKKLNNEDMMALKQVWTIIDIQVDEEFDKRNL